MPGVDYGALMLEPCDGRVTKASLPARDSLAPDATQSGLFPIAYAVFICRMSNAEREDRATLEHGSAPAVQELTIA